VGRYITDADLAAPVGGTNILTQLADLDNDGSYDPAVTAQAIEESESLAESYISPLYWVPVPAPVPTILKLWCVDIARWRLASGRGLGNLELYRQNYDDAIRALTAVRDGKNRLNIGTKPTGSTLVNVGGILEPLSHDEGGPYWDEDWREEGTTEEEIFS
jgi:phage gp36-like protein